MRNNPLLVLRMKVKCFCCMENTPCEELKVKSGAVFNFMKKKKSCLQ